jgi:hypothetical protein
MFLGDILTILKGFNLFQFTYIFYLSVADGLYDPEKITSIYAGNVLFRWIYTLFGAYGVFGSKYGMNLGFRLSLVISLAMMVILDVIDHFMQTDQEKKAYQPFISANPQSILVIIIFMFLLSSIKPTNQ